MKKEDQYQNNNEDYIPQWEDAEYQQDLRVDPLTTMDTIKSELATLEKAQADRENLAALAAKTKSEEDDYNDFVAKYEEAKRSEADESKAIEEVQES